MCPKTVFKKNIYGPSHLVNLWMCTWTFDATNLQQYCMSTNIACDELGKHVQYGSRVCALSFFVLVADNQSCVRLVWNARNPHSILISRKCCDENNMLFDHIISMLLPTQIFNISRLNDFKFIHSPGRASASAASDSRAPTPPRSDAPATSQLIFVHEHAFWILTCGARPKKVKHKFSGSR